jgi:hypothetical protein
MSYQPCPRCSEIVRDHDETGELGDHQCRGFRIKVRTSPGAPMTADYECPVHGRFEATVERDDVGDPPTETACPHRVEPRSFALFGVHGEERARLFVCGKPSPWRISCPPVHTQFVVTASHGKSAAKPHPETMDTRMLAEGRKNEFRKQRKKLKEERRHRRVKALLS